MAVLDTAICPSRCHRGTSEPIRAALIWMIEGCGERGLARRGMAGGRLAYNRESAARRTRRRGIGKLATGRRVGRRWTSSAAI